MNYLVTFLISSLFFMMGVSPVHAQAALTPTLPDVPTASQSAEFADSSDNAEGILEYIIGVVTGIDSFFGGLVFTTPNVFADTISLPGGGEVEGFAEFRTVFLVISISVVAIVLAIMGSSIAMGRSDFNPQQFLFRFLLTGALVAAVPQLLELSIEGTNALNEQLLQLGRQSSVEITIGQLLIDILTNILQQVASGTSPAAFGLPSTQLSILGSLVQSVAVVIFETFVFLLTFLFFILGFLFIIFQFVIRFLSILFLSILYPFVIPFALSDKTYGVVKAYLMAWVGFLIHQPAFILGFMIVRKIFNALLTADGATLGMLFLYAGSMFFLAGINVLVNRIFGEPWTAIGTNIQAAVSSAGMLALPMKAKQGMIGGSVNGFTSLAGRGLAKKNKWLSQDGRTFNFAGVKPPQEPPGGGNNPSGSASQAGVSAGTRTVRNTAPSVTQEMQKRNIPVEPLNRKTGEVQLKRTPVYAYDHPEKPLVVNYLSKDDAVKDGLRPEQLRKTSVEGKMADYSAFYKTGFKNPYNTNATNIKKQTGFKGKAHAKFTSSEDYMRDHMTLNKDYFAKKGINGVIGKRNGNYNGVQNKEKVIRIYTMKGDQK